MGFEAARVAEVYAPTGGRAADFGSGYVVADGLVLTARHIVERASGQCQVRLVGQEQWSDATGVWRGVGECDAALLRIPEPAPGAAARLGRLATGVRAACRALGFPLAQAKGRVRDTEEIVGEVAPLSAYKRGLLSVHIAGSVPDRDSSGHSPWEGYSGAALFCGPLLVGVLTVDPTNFGTSRLEAVPVAAMAEDADFRAALGVSLPERLPALEDEPARALLSPPYARLPARATPEFLRRSPIHLLYPQYGVVPFHGREAELGDLTQWLEEGELAVGLLLGRGGSGKTRLAAEFCRAHANGLWLGGFVVPAADIQTLASSVSPLLLIVDEAETRVDELAAFINHFARIEREQATRLLLVSREGGEWWEEGMPRRLDLESRPLIDRPWEREVRPLDERVSVRHELFEAAVRSFAEKTQRPSDNLSRPDLTSTLFDRVLFIHLAALTALEAERVPRSAVVGGALLEARLTQERRYWESSARQEGLQALDLRVLQRAVAVATLSPAETEGEAADLLAAVPDLADEGEGLRRQIARWLRSLYPGEGFFRPLEPDLLGEHLVGSVLGDVPELGTNLLARLAREPTWTLTVLTRAARNYQTAEVALREALTQHLPSLWGPAIDVAEEAGDPIGRLLAEVLAATPQSNLAGRIVERLPTETVALRELAAVATQQSLQNARAKPAGPDRDEEVADLSDQLSHRLSDLGRDEEALAAIQEAIEIKRKLANSDPDTFLPGLSGSLSNLALRLSDLGRYREALAASEEAVATNRGLADADPDTFLPALSTSLNNLSNDLAIVGREDDALAAIEETIAIVRELADAEPDTFLPKLANSLNTFHNRLGDVGRDEEALAAIEEAVAIERDLVRANPDATLPELAASLNNLSTSLDALERHELALAASQESVAIRRRLAETRPGAFLPDLAESLNNLSIELGALDHDEEALAAIEETVAIARRLAEANPDAYLAHLAGNLNNRANLLGDLNRTEDALVASEEAVAIGRDLVDADPDVFRPNLAMSLNNLALVLDELGHAEEALAANEEAVAIARDLADARPQAFLPELSQKLKNLSGSLQAVGRHEEAVSALEDAVAIDRRLVNVDPNAFLSKLATSLHTYSYALTELGRAEEALAANEEAVAIGRDLAADDTEPFLADLARFLTTLGRRLPDLGRAEEALAALEEAVTINRRLADADPDAFVPELADSLDLLAAFLNAFGFADDAAAATEAVTIYRRLADANPDRLSMLAASLDNLYLALAMLGRGEESLAALEEEVAINRRLAEADPDGFLAKLAQSLNTHASELSGLDRDKEALAASEEAVAIGRDLAVGDTDDFGVQVAPLLNTLSSSLSAVGRDEEAVAALEEAVAMGRDRADSEDLADWLDSLALLLYGLDRDEEAKTASEEAVAINRRLAEADPDDFPAKLADSLDTLSLALYALDRDQEAVAASEEAVAIGQQLAAADAAFLPDLSRWLENLANALDAVGRDEEARAALEEARAIDQDLGDEG